MIRAFLDGNELKLYPNTPIGITIENFNLSDIPNRKIDRTNSIEVPKSGNETIFEFASLPNAPSDFAYNDYDFDLIVDGIKIYDNGRAYIVNENDDSYILNVTNNKNIIDLLKSISLADLYSGDTVTLINTTTWKDLFAGNTNGFKIDYLFDDAVPTADTYGFAAGIDYISIYIDTILTKIETDYDITFSGDLLTDSDFLEMRVPLVQSNLKRDNGSTDIYIDDIVIHDSLTAWDLIKNVMQLTCAVFKISGTDMELQKFNDLDTASPADWSGKLVSKSKGFAVPETAQENFIKYTVGDDVDEYALAAQISCNNTNLDIKKDLGQMKAKLFLYLDMNQYYSNASTSPLVTPFMPITDTDFPGLPSDPSPTRVKGLKDLMIFVDSAEYLGQPLTVNMQYYYENTPGSWTNPILNGSITTDAFTLMVAYYDPNPNYTLIESILTDPVFYTVDLLLNIVDIHDFDHFKAVKIDELGGIFYVNRINNFLATSPGVPTSVELIKIS
jgi:hypothetical protein